MSRRIAHVGLGKTATTSLQAAVFPLYAEHLGVPYLWCNSEDLRRLNAELLVRHSSSLAPDCFPDRFLLSCENLASWDPHWWEAHAQSLASTLGADTHILITLREPRSWMTSVYVQRCLHEGNVLRPEQFFLDANTYGEYLSTPKFDVASFRYTALVNAYRSRFQSVTVVPFEHISELTFIEDLSAESSFDIDQARRAFADTRSNRSYSRRSIGLTLRLDKALSYLGLSLSPLSKRYSLRALETLRAPNRRLAVGGEAARDRGIARRAVRRIIRELNWRRFVQGRLDRILPYVKYELDFNALPWIPIEFLEDDYAVATESIGP